MTNFYTASMAYYLSTTMLEERREQAKKAGLASMTEAAVQSSNPLRRLVNSLKPYRKQQPVRNSNQQVTLEKVKS
ncbi:MAG: hypothetical protein K8L99_34720 [Anaerolineae bacterium]|nr:hypothetical protein [Anaerolineae bacterium]